MSPQDKITLFEESKVRTAWDETTETWYFSVVDVVAVLTQSVDATSYWRKLKQRLSEESDQPVTICHVLKLRAIDGKMRMTDVANLEGMFRIIQSIPSPKAEPFKRWMASVASDRIDQMQDPELSIEQAMTDYRRLGYSENWINQRIKSIEIRKELTDEWKRCGLQEGVQFATLTDIITKTWSGHSTKEYKQLKGLKKENLRDNMTNRELVLGMLAELSTRDISVAIDPETMAEHKEVARRGGNVAKTARLQLEKETGQKVVSPLNAKRIKVIDKKSR